MCEISELHLLSECATLLSITRAKLSIRFLILLILFASVCTMKSIIFYVLYTISSVLPPILCPVPLGILFSLQTQHRIKNVSCSPYRTKIQEPLSFSPSHHTTDIFTAVVAAGHTFDFSFTPLNCSSFNVEHNS